MIKTILSTALVAAVFVYSGVARAAPVLDQQAAPFGGSLYEGFEWQQEVTAGVTGQLAGLTLYGAGTNVTVRVNPGSGFHSGPYAFSQAVQLASGGTYIDTSSANIQLTAGQQFVIDLFGGSGGNIFAAATPHPGGSLFLNLGVPSDFTACCNFGLAFRTFVEPAGGGGGAVPEPDAWALMILGFGGAGAVLRRRGQGVLAAA
jgi:hypothetical protein